MNIDPCANHPQLLKKSIFFGFICLNLLTACGGGGAGSSYPSQALGGGFAAGEVRALTFNGDHAAEINFTELSGDEKFSLVLFAANAGPGAFQFQLDGLGASAQSKFLAPPVELAFEIEAELAGEDATSDLHEILREQEKDFAQLEPLAPEADNQGKALATTVESCAGGHGRIFRVLASLSNNQVFENVCGVALRETENAVYYVDEAVLSTLDSRRLNPIITEFEAKIPHERRLLGRESDVDGNGKFSVLFTPAINRLGATGGGFVTGYFFGGDLYPRSGITSSNEHEVLFICVPDPNGIWGFNLSTEFWSSNIARSVIPHEFQHMISFNQHVLIGREGAEEAWANEGLSHLIEDLDTAGGMEQAGSENPSRVSVYLDSLENLPFTGGTSIAQRGGSYLFFRYLYEQADLGRYPNAQDGPELLRNLLHGETKGVPNIEEATGWTFRNLLLDFFAAVHLSNRKINSDSRYNFRGISLHGPQNDNRGTVLAGVTPRQLGSVPHSGSIQSASGIFIEINGKTLKKMGQGLSFTVPPSMIPGGAIIRTY